MLAQPPNGGILRRGLHVMWRQVRLRPAPFAIAVLGAVVYAVTAAQARRRSPLKDLADATGGQLLEVTSSRDLRGAFQRILQDFRSRYILSYSPTGVPTDGFHRLEVRTKRRGLTVRARPGYVGVSRVK